MYSEILATQWIKSSFDIHSIINNVSKSHLEKFG